MKKRYAPDVPDAKWHRPGDTAYLRELLEAAGLSQRKAGPLLGMDERSMRNRISGDRPLAYSEQYCLEVLADLAQQETTMNAVANTVHDAPAPEHALTQWFRASERPLQDGDAGKMIVARDRFGSPIFGTLVRDGFGLVIRDMGDVPIDRVALYTLLDPPTE